MNKKNKIEFERVAVNISGESIEVRRTHTIDYFGADYFAIEIKFEEEARIFVFGNYYKETHLNEVFERITKEPERFEVVREIHKNNISGKTELAIRLQEKG